MARSLDFKLLPREILSVVLWLAAIVVAAEAGAVAAQDVTVSKISEWNEGRTGALAIEGTLLLAGVDSAVAVLDVSDPALPVVLGRVNVGFRPRDVVLEGSYAFVVDHRAWFHVVDVSDPAQPVVVSSTATTSPSSPAMGHRVRIQNEVAYVASNAGFGCVCAFDVSVPAEPRSLGKIANYANDLVIVDTQFYFFTSGAGTYMYEIQSLEPLDRNYRGISANDAVHRAELLGSHVVQVGGDFHVADLSRPFEPQEVARISGMAGQGLALKDDFAYVAGNSGLHVVDVLNPEIPELLASYPTRQWLEDVVVEGDLVFVAAGEDGVLTFEVDAQRTSLSVDRRFASDVAIALEATYPNPAAADVSIRYRIAQAGEVRLLAYDVLGREVGVLVEDHRAAGSHEIVWRGDGLPAGIYLLRIEANGSASTQTVTLLR